MPQCSHYVNLMLAAAMGLIRVHRTAAWERWHVSLVVRISEHIKVVQFYNFEIVLQVATVL